jgi:methyl-accepting chemotaxis protein
MDHVVQQNASLVEEATAATEAMKDQSSALLELVSRFRLSAEPGDAPRETPPASPQRGGGSYISAPQLPPVLAGMLPGTAAVDRPRGAWRAF